MDDAEVGRRARRLAAAIEPFSAQVYFAPECHERYAAIGFGPSPGARAGVASPDGPAYFTSRGSVMGQVAGEVAAAAFAVFNPAVVVPAVTAGWGLTDAVTVAAARTAGAVAQLERVLGPEPAGIGRVADLLEAACSVLRPEGRPLYAGMSSQPVPDGALGRAWRLADRLREYRGDCHTAAWTSAGFDAVEIGLLSELYWGVPLKSYIRTRGWAPPALEAGCERLAGRGLIADGAFTDAGRRAREDVERATDRPCRNLVEVLGDDLEELAGRVEAMSRAVQAAGGYPAAGPHDMARAATGG